MSVVDGVSTRLVSELIFDRMDVAVSTGWRDHGYTAARIYLKSVSIAPECRSAPIDEGMRHLIASGVLDLASLVAIANDVGVSSAVVSEIIAGYAPKDAARVEVLKASA